MTGLRRFRFALFLALGFALLPASSAWSLRDIVAGQIVPHGDEGIEYFGGSGAPNPEGIGAGSGDATRVERQLPRADRVQITAPILYELVRSVWLLTWKTGVLP